MKIAFHCNQLSIRGTEVAMYDYAHYNETILCNESIILAKHPSVWPYSDPKAIEKFQNRFKVFLYYEIGDIEHILDNQDVDIFYAQKSGQIDGVVSAKRKTVIHAVFQDFQPHGDVYACISEWLANVAGGLPFVPYMVYLPEHNENMREELGIPKNAMVFGRHGGFETFDIGYAREAVVQVATLNPNIYFVFMNTEKFSNPDLKNIIYLESTADLYEKVRFINTCDAMIHARIKGESFGLAIAEFSIRNKPVITCRNAYDKAHLELLGSKGMYYSTKDELVHLLTTAFPIRSFLSGVPDWNCYKEFTPAKVMEKFKQVFIDDKNSKSIQ